MRRWSVVLSVVLTIVSALMVTSVVRAAGGKPEPEPDPIGDVKMFNGTFCQPRFGNQVGDFRWYLSGIMNISDSYREVTCPILRDNASSSAPILWAEVRARKPVGVEYCCTIYSFNNVQEVTASEEKCFSPLYEYGDIGLGYDLETPFHYALYCNVPPSGWVLRYLIIEGWPTDENN